MMDALDAILSKPPQNRDAIENMLLQHDYPDEARKAAEKYAQLQAIATAVRPLVGTMQNLIDDNRLESPEVLNDVWVQVLGSDLVKLAAALAALEQETK